MINAFNVRRARNHMIAHLALKADRKLNKSLMIFHQRWRIA